MILYRSNKYGTSIVIKSWLLFIRYYVELTVYTGAGARTIGSSSLELSDSESVPVAKNLLIFASYSFFT